MLIAVLLGLFSSSVNVPPLDILKILGHHLLGLNVLGDIPKHIEMIVWNIRVPRVILGLLVGASLSLAGAAFQGLLRNPLADPYTIGVSSGASLAAVIIIYFQFAFIGMFTLPVAAIIGGFAALLLVLLLTRWAGRGFAIETIVLAGIIISSFISAVISLIIALSEREGMTQILYWLMGNIGMRGWNHVVLALPFILIGIVILLLQSRELNALSLGEKSAHHLGVNVRRRKYWILVGASLLTGASVAVSGTIGFVGLVIPHLVRYLTGPNHRHVLPVSMMIGGGYLVLADLLSRTIIAPKELPIGVITALIGAPVFAILLVREKWGRGRS